MQKKRHILSERPLTKGVNLLVVPLLWLSKGKKAIVAIWLIFGISSEKKYLSCPFFCCHILVIFNAVVHKLTSRLDHRDNNVA